MAKGLTFIQLELALAAMKLYSRQIFRRNTVLTATLDAMQSDLAQKRWRHINAILKIGADGGSNRRLPA